MDHKPKCKMQNCIKLLEYNVEENLDDFYMAMFKYSTNGTIHEKKLTSQTSLKLKISALQKTMSSEWEDKIKWERLFAKMHLIKACYPKHTKLLKLSNNQIQ